MQLAQCCVLIDAGEPPVAVHYLACHHDKVHGVGAPPLDHSVEYRSFRVEIGIGDLVPIDKDEIGSLANRQAADPAAKGRRHRAPGGCHAQDLADARNILPAIPGKRCARNTIRISCSMSRSSLMPASSRPIAVLMPRCSKKLSGARPLRRRKLELQLWWIWVPVAAMRSRSGSLSHTPCPNVSRGPRNPKRSIYSRAVPPPRRRAYSF